MPLMPPVDSSLRPREVSPRSGSLRASAAPGPWSLLWFAVVRPDSSMWARGGALRSNYRCQPLPSRSGGLLTRLRRPSQGFVHRPIVAPSRQEPRVVFEHEGHARPTHLHDHRLRVHAFKQECARAGVGFSCFGYSRVRQLPGRLSDPFCPSSKADRRSAQSRRVRTTQAPR